MFPLVRYGFGVFLLLFFTTVWAQVEIPELNASGYRPHCYSERSTSHGTGKQVGSIRG